MKPTVSPLLQHIAYLAKRRLSDPEAPLTTEGRGMLQHFAGRPLKHSHWLQITARELGLEYNQVSRESKLFEAYCDFNVQRRFWVIPVRFVYQPDVYSRQLQALGDAADGNRSLAETAAQHDVTFDQFDFSSSLLEYLIAKVGTLTLNFYGVSAKNSVIWEEWLSQCTSFERADLRNCKFVRLYEDPTIRPGTNIYEGNFAHANLAGADLRGSYLRGADFFGANLEGADLRNANLYESRLTGAKGPYKAGEVESSVWHMDKIGA
ncbi:pentapeptide repeat-containing protein [Pseudomonas veronii]|uniref:pentapeptide repeat-containing protein n=1 Tax=Pseudomonas veronii TaxID=76761 RepID=UPI002D77BBA2|nr:pentapeptide repeat-containing protein [Pseudomonas veronii]WRU60348.1 pentapeptide repeat-containing protein [Pseudomonas veronii]